MPDYASNGLTMTRANFGAAWFEACWAYEESKHGLVFREYLTRSGLRTDAEMSALQDQIVSGRWTLPFHTIRRMACYGAMQEAATCLAYRMQRDRAKSSGNTVLEAIFSFVSRDEAAHADFYRTVLEIELNEDRVGTLADFAHVLSQFKMPGDGLIPNYRERLETSGAGISPRSFAERVVVPLMKTLETSRKQLKQVLSEVRLRPREISNL